MLQFSGLNDSRFYFLAKQNIIDWKIFDKASLSRFDIYYSRENNKQDKISSADFLENCYKKIKQTSKNVTLEFSSKKIYYIQSFRNRFSKERNSIQAQVKREIIHEFNTLIQYKIIEPKFLFQLKDNQKLIYKEDIQLRDIQSSEFIYFYEILHSI